ncbi:LOW QUALITY PROTEIN: neogenin-like [Lethenteron reissneri]|uniref:LOW QUALITY PROTEIN: neogenin-like n=1 Tax=Lethenteron reissneri TaxID=7753 RepID=UPI002AB694B1|nr:LOW QUALITY PROTEIN: neogenin-like [Lethenteron reissneri]
METGAGGTPVGGPARRTRRSGGPGDTSGPVAILAAAVVVVTLAAFGFTPGSAAPGFATALRFVTEPSDTVAVRASSARLNCSARPERASGAAGEDDVGPAVRVEWKRDGVILALPLQAEGEQQQQQQEERRVVLASGALLLRSVQHGRGSRSDEGRYECVATAPGIGTIVSRAARLSIAGAVRVAAGPGHVSVHAGDGAVLPCEVSGEPRPSVRWIKDVGEPGGEPGAARRVVTLPDGALQISRAEPSDAGTYRCVAENAAFSRTGDDIRLTVVPEPGVARRAAFLRVPKDVEALLGQAAMLECSASGFPRPTVRWEKGGKAVHESEHVKVVGGGHLLVEVVTPGDAGLYSCTVGEGADTMQASAVLTVHAPPRFSFPPRDALAHEGADVELACGVEGNPAPSIKWLKNGDTVIPGDYFHIAEEHTLKILGVVKSDEGMYQCVAENEHGNVQAGAQLLVADRAGARTGGGSGGASPAPSAPRDLVAAVVSTRFVRLVWRAPAEPRGDVTAYAVFHSRDGASRERVVNTSKTGDLQITISDLRPETTYTFRVVAYNRHGLGESSAPLKISTQPEVQVPGPPVGLQATALSPTSVSVFWQPPLSGNGPILNYRLLHVERGKGPTGEQEVDVEGLSFVAHGLKRFTEYSFRVVAFNRHGPGLSSEDVTARTLSDVPSAPPQNVTVEVLNSKAILVRWQPPPPSAHNGVIVGYRIRHRKTGRRSEAEVTESSQLWHQLAGLERGTEYSFKVSALTVNGTGPSSDWVSSETFEEDLDESRVPEQPSSLHVRPLTTNIVVSWTPPAGSDVMVRGYFIGYGVGSPYADTVRVDAKQRYFTIEGLEPNHQYVISLRAFNNMGQGVPLYESATTRSITDSMDPSEPDPFDLFSDAFTAVPEPPTPMLPPVGVQALVLGPDTIRITWADNSLPKNQRIPDARYYTARWKTYFTNNAKYKMANSTTLSYLVTGLKASTLYEFSVMVTRGRRSSTWSMTAQSTTLEAVPTSAPKDLTIISKEGKPRIVIVNWQPPSEANGKITGYIIYYTTDKSAELHDWVIEPVVGDRLSHQVQELTLDTLYFFKIQARNSKGMGPMSEPVTFRTPRAPASGRGAPGSGIAWAGSPSLLNRATSNDGPTGQQHPLQSSRGSALDNNLLIIVIVTVGGLTVICAIVVAVVCTRRSAAAVKSKRAAPKSPNGSGKRKGSPKDLKPPDLWIHHETVALKPLDKAQGPGVGGGPGGGGGPGPSGPSGPADPHSAALQCGGGGGPDVERGDAYTNHQRGSYSGKRGEDGISSSLERSIAARQAMRLKLAVPSEHKHAAPHHHHHQQQQHHHHHHTHLSHSAALLPSPAPPPVPSPPASPLRHHYPPCQPPHYGAHYPGSPPGDPQERGSHLVEIVGVDVEELRSGGLPPLPPAGEGSSSGEYEEPRPVVPTAHVRPTQPLRSFAVPLVSAHGALRPSDSPLLSHHAGGHSPLLSHHTGSGSPKVATLGTLGRLRVPLPVILPSAPDSSAHDSQTFEDSDSTYGHDDDDDEDDLSAEMANLEGLMKDLNAITSAGI